MSDFLVIDFGLTFPYKAAEFNSKALDFDSKAVQPLPTQLRICFSYTEALLPFPTPILTYSSLDPSICEKHS